MRWLVLVLLVVSAVGCKKKTAPEFYRLEGDVSVLVSREGDEAWESEEMAAIEQRLVAIPGDVLEAPKVQALVQKLQGERARVKAEREANAVKPSADPGAVGTAPAAASGSTNGDEIATGDEAGPADAGARGEPTLGMSEADFVAAFGACFSSGPGVNVPDAGRGSSQVVLDRPECVARFGEKGTTTSWVFVDGKLSGRQFQGPSTIEYIDAGSPPPKALPPPPTPFDAGTMLSFPGAPRPDNMEPAPGSPGSKVP